MDIFLAHLIDGQCDDRDVVTFSELLRDHLGGRCLGSGAVHQDDKRLPDALQFLDHFCFRFNVGISWQFTDRAVCRDDDADRRMIADDLLCAHLRCLVERNRLFIPRCAHHPHPIFILVSLRLWNDIADTVHQAHISVESILKSDIGCCVGNEFRFGRHDRLADPGLRQFIDHPCTLIFIFDIGNDRLLHKVLDKCGFSHPYRSDNA